MTKALRIELVRAAIQRVEIAKQLHLDAQADPYSHSDARIAAKARYEATEREFGWQWQNVKAILDEASL